MFFYLLYMTISNLFIKIIISACIIHGGNSGTRYNYGCGVFQVLVEVDRNCTSPLSVLGC